MKSANLEGNRYGKWVVLERDYNVSNRDVSYKCKCDCGNEKVVVAYHLYNGKSKSCGCYKSVWATENKTTHGHTKTKVYRAWCKMKERCLSVNDKAYKSYGGRGIVICERWLESFENFYADMGLPPTEKHSLERDDVNGNYCKDNCRWATDAEQRRNQRRTVIIKYNGVDIVQNDFVKKYNINLSTFRTNYNKGMALREIIDKFSRL